MKIIMAQVAQENRDVYFFNLAQRLNQWSLGGAIKGHLDKDKNIVLSRNLSDYEQQLLQKDFSDISFAN